VQGTAGTQFFHWYSNYITLEDNEQRPYLWVFGPDYAYGNVMCVDYTNGLASPALLLNTSDFANVFYQLNTFVDIFPIYGRYILAAVILDVYDGTGTINLYDVTVPANMFQIGIISDPRVLFPSLIDVSYDYTTLWTTTSPLGTGDAIVSIDIRNPLSPYVREFQNIASIGSAINALFSQAGLLWVASATDGTFLYSVNGPTYTLLDNIGAYPQYGTGNPDIGSLGFCDNEHVDLFSDVWTVVYDDPTGVYVIELLHYNFPASPHSSKSTTGAAWAALGIALFALFVAIVLPVYLYKRKVHVSQT